MEPRDPRSLLWDAMASIENVRQFVEGRTEADYHAQRILRSAVERDCEIIGKSLGK
jgi:uncharacterized protein with HEPN domain